MIKKIHDYFNIMCLIAIIMGTASLQAQKIKSKVNIVLERLPIEKQKKLQNLSDMIETYINTYDYTGSPSDIEIPITIQIFLQDNSVNYESRYSGTFLISNMTDIQYYDKYWKFPYQEGTTLVHIENAYDPFTGLMDFYLNILLGGEFDKYGKLAGSPFYEKAKLIKDQAKFDTKFVWGWEERTRLIDFLFSEENTVFRLAKDLFFTGFSYVGRQDTTARRFCAHAVVEMEKVLTENPDHKEAVQFLNVHNLEIVDVLKNDRRSMEILARIDPDRADIYKGYLKN